MSPDPLVDIEQHFEGRLTRVETTLDSMSSRLGSIENTIKDLATVVSQSSRTDWKIVFAGVAAIIAFLSIYVQPLRTEVEFNAAIVGKLEARMELADQRIEAKAASASSDIGNTLRSEIKTTHALFEAKLDGLDTRIQREMRDMDQVKYWQLKFEQLRDRVYPDQIYNQEIESGR